MKIIGAIIIILACTFFGFELANKLTRRTKQIRYLKIAFESLETEMVFGMTPLPNACEKVGDQVPPPISSLFKEVAHKLETEENSAPHIWNSMIKKWAKSSDLNHSEINILTQFGQTLGLQDLENQRKQIRLAISYFDQEEKEAMESQKKFESMYKSLGFLGGVLVVIIML